MFARYFRAYPGPACQDRKKVGENSYVVVSMSLSLTFTLKIVAEELMAGMVGVSVPSSAADAVVGRGFMPNV
jgi:hypothetical protein